MRPILSTTFFLLLITSCSPLPSMLVHDKLPAKTRNGTAILHRPPPIPYGWWKKIHDRNLDQLMDEALQKNEQILAAEANIQEAAALFKAAHFAWLPSVNGSAAGFAGNGFDSSIQPHGILAQSQALNGINNQRFNGYYAGFIPNYSLNILQNIKASDYARASLSLQRAKACATRLSITSQVAGGYFMLLGQKKLLHLQTHMLHELQHMRFLESVRHHDGGADLSAITQLDQQIHSKQAQKKSIEESVAQLENALRVLMAQNPGPIATHRSIQNIHLRGLIPAYLPSSVLKHRPDIVMAEANLKMASANLGIAYARFFPNISLTGLLGGASLELTHLLSFSSGIWLAQGVANLPLINAANYEHIVAAKAAYQAAFFSYRNTLHSAFAEVDDKLTTLEKKDAAYHYQEQALDAAKKNGAIAEARYQSGARDYRDVTQAKLSVDEAKYQLILAKMEQLDSLVGVYQALAWI
jgi:multidrug efflux system outer membrane protein